MGAKSLSSDRVWLNEADRIASFHRVVGYELKSFLTHDSFLNFLHTLAERGFRFQ